ncbi:MAG: hypothetical protein Q8O40_09380, partial [Chloroflexota bacterium]|nr:hypothetical protein [Chloroflexota bacterium]
MDPFTGAVNSFLPLNAATVGQDITDANGLVLMPSSAPSGADLYVSRGGIGAASKILKVVDASPTSSGAGDTQDSFSEVFADLPIGDIVSSDGYSTIWAANVQTDLTKQITVRDLYLYDGSSPSPDINLPANVTGGGFTGLTWLPSDYQFLGAYGNKMVQFDTTGLVVANFTVEDVGSIQGVLLWPGQEPTLLVADGSDGAIKKVVIATTLDAELAYSLPTAPGAPSGSAVKGLETDSWTGNLVVLVRGTPTDVLLFLDPTDGTLLDSLKLDVAHVGEDISDSEGVGVQSGDVFVIRGTGASKKIQRVQDNWTLDDTLPEIPVTDSLPGGGLTHDFYGQLLEADQQTGFPGTSTIPVRQYNPVTGAEGLTVDVTGIPSNGGFTALSHNDWTGNYVGAFGNQISDFDVMTGAVFQVYSAKGVSDIQGMEAITWESTPAGGFLVANGADNKLYKVLLPEGGGGGVPPLPRAVANEGGFLYIVVDGSTKDKVLKVR